MKEVFEAIYDALISHSGLFQLATGGIRRGWQEPVDSPSVRFFSDGSDSRGDDFGRHETIHANFTVSVLSGDDLEIEQIAQEVCDAMDVESLQNNSVVFHSCFFNGDRHGTFFDPVRKLHRRDLTFTLIYSNHT
ncbi:MAG: hypothetical protein ABIG42_09730 [bacterium]